MTLKIISTEDQIPDQDVNNLALLCDSLGIEATLEFKDGQYFMHSDTEKEKPIGIQIEGELNRHEEFFKRSSIVKELLARSIGVKGGYRPRVLDLTGGLLGDTLLFLSFGCEVITLERHPIVSFLIQSALKKSQHSALSRLKFYPQDALSFLQEDPEVDVIFFDPMFEDANQKALPKKEMRIFRQFVGSDEDAKEVFEKARSWKPKRLVVKRPRHSKTLAEKPDVVFEGKATRYDVYLSQNHGTFGSNPLE